VSALAVANHEIFDLSARSARSESGRDCRGTSRIGVGEEVFEVEFSDEEGRTYAERALPARQLMALRYAPVAG